MTTPPSDLDLLLVAIAAIPTPWKKWPRGYPDRLDLALVDAVASIRFRYGRERGDGTWTGARGAVIRYAKYSEHIPAAEKVEHLAAQDPVAPGAVVPGALASIGMARTEAGWLKGCR